MGKEHFKVVTDTDSIVPLVGYSDRLSVRPGETISFKISSIISEICSAWLMRSISADPNPDGTGIVEERVSEAFPEYSFQPQYQPFFPGSYAITDQALNLSPGEGFLIIATIFPTLAKSSHQTVLGIADLELFIDENGAAAIRVNDRVLSTNVSLELRNWYRLEVICDARKGTLSLKQTSLKGLSNPETMVSVSIEQPIQRIKGYASIAAYWDGDQAINHFNGKIENPEIYRNSELDRRNLIARWDFSKEISSTVVYDTGPDQFHTKLVNFPTRAVTGSKWDASEMCWRHAPEHYSAIHFHEDDIYDFEWHTSFTFSVPDNLSSGVYVMRIRCGEYEDAIPFYVCAPENAPSAKLCVVIPTFTYVVYGNHCRSDYDLSWKKRIAQWKAYPYNPAEFPGYGLSTYNNHADGSGVCHASHRRPLFNLRPGYLTFGAGAGSGLRHFQADSHLISWLHTKGIAYDVITDHDLHDRGLSAIENYQAVMTTSHPEYHTLKTLQAFQEYRDCGGNLLYLGGNGFYWRIARHEHVEGMIEIRRAEDGIRAWAAEPGEYYNAFDGTYGGLWRRNGRPPQMLVGIGFSAQGKFNGSYYQRMCHDPNFDWIFKGIDEEKIGDFGFSGGGAAGYELDRADCRLGTPENVTLLASSKGHGDDYILVPEEQLTHLANLPGEPTEKLLRADMIYFQTPDGGSVFATGSITFCGSLPWNDFENNISKLLENVVKRMTQYK